jgi:hypothetical protein
VGQEETAKGYKFGEHRLKQSVTIESLGVHILHIVHHQLDRIQALKFLRQLVAIFVLLDGGGEAQKRLVCGFVIIC